MATDALTYVSSGAGSQPGIDEAQSSNPLKVCCIAGGQGQTRRERNRSDLGILNGDRAAPFPPFGDDCGVHAGRLAVVRKGAAVIARLARELRRPSLLYSVEHRDRLWLRGGFPRAYLADTLSQSAQWRESFVRTFLERNIPQLGITIPAETLRRFWTMVAHFHGQVWNAAELARSLGSSESTARRYLDILAGAYMVRVLPPWHERLKKRQVKAPRTYIRDTGLLHSLLQIQTLAELQGHPKIGASWEGFALEQTIRALRTRDAYFWATHAGAELDLMVPVAGKRFGFE